MGNVEGRSLKKAYCLDISGFFLRSVELSSSWALGGNLVDNSRLLLSTEYKLKFWAPILICTHRSKIEKYIWKLLVIKLGFF